MIGIGVVGYGYWGPNMARNLADARGTELRTSRDLRSERVHRLNFSDAIDALNRTLRSAPTACP